MATVTLTWTPTNNATSTGQQVQRKLASSPTWVTIATVGASIATYVDTTAADNVLYDYRVLNVCSVGGPTSSGVTQASKIICPTVTVTNPQTGAANTLLVSYPTLSGDVSYDSIQLFASNGTTSVQGPFDISGSGQGAGTYTFTSLTYSTSYVVKIGLTDGTFIKFCSYNGSVGTAPACGAPLNLTAVVV
jgi:hypothetical protein